MKYYDIVNIANSANFINSKNITNSLMVNYNKNIIDEFRSNLLKLEEVMDEQKNNHMEINANLSDEERQSIQSIQNKYNMTFVPDNEIEFLKDIEKCFSSFENLCHFCASNSNYTDDSDDSDDPDNEINLLSNLKKKQLIKIIDDATILLHVCFIIIFVLSIAYFRK